MIAKSPEEKQALKLAKQKHNAAVKEYEAKKIQPKESPKFTFQKDGILQCEHLLPDDYPVHADFLYVIDDEGGKVIRSDVFGTVKKLKQDLRNFYKYKALNVYSCDYYARRKPIE